MFPVLRACGLIWPITHSHTCLSLSFAFPLPDTRDEVTSRGMTEIWCSGMFIPAEPTRDAHKHTSCPAARAKGMMVWTTTPYPAEDTEDSCRLTTRSQDHIQIRYKNILCNTASGRGWSRSAQLETKMKVLKGHGCILCFHIICWTLDWPLPLLQFFKCF